MRKLIYSMGISLDGFIAGPGGEIDWAAPDEELHRFHNSQMAEIGVHLCGRRLYETMLYWETAAEDPSLPDTEREFAGIWQGIEKIVFSKTLDGLDGNAVPGAADAASQAAELKRLPGRDIAVGGAGLAASVSELIDEYRMFLSPVLLGDGTRYFPPTRERLELELIETRTFGSRVVYLRYARA
jgi:dihydrofolate reductase